MNIDAEEHLAAVQRSVSILERDGQPAGAVSLSRSFDTTLEGLWEAITGPERIPRWFLPVSGDLKLGGHYQLEGNAGGTIIACERLSHFSLSHGNSAATPVGSMCASTRTGMNCLGSPSRIQPVFPNTGTPTGPVRWASAGKWPSWDSHST